MDLAVMGLTNREVADHLALSVHAVKFHLAGVYRKLGVGNRTAAAVAYLKVREAPETLSAESRFDD